MTDKLIRLDNEIEDILSKDFRVRQNNNCEFINEIYASYNDVLSDDTIVSIIESEYPEETINELMYEFYSDEDFAEIDVIKNDTYILLTYENGPYPKMTLKDLIKLNQLIRHQEDNGHYYDARKRPYCGYITIDKTAICGLFNPWDGGGSLMDIVLEKDVNIPVKYIRCAYPDGSIKHEYGVDSVYGFIGSAWRKVVKNIHVPDKLAETSEYL